ncbi:DMSO/TMAO reductase YedYZ molybdopterin-dependent catalytic subunit [Thermocatellispora tengchongensis]|uniref:DMSO/TMAO reductase YedYZ molybdopterin-dependent catalytic subunit n=1 Tax=Thermocatellispora tengchongensis TaxID=1073253 RepID=A0A840P056_9ACTN|nr:sulfite oxidase [Thermocatellispora tengchongensis]MBB5131323.1 DMSO/TMAO reductase YedYZ molybdopterin-dependent catalytic subunit [Thermocatellispora tengchongensis]
MTESGLGEISGPGRVAEVDEGISLEELALAARNHGMPLEAMRYDVTPLGLHYLLIHYDIPMLDPDAWRLAVGGLVGEPLVLDLAALRAMPRRTVRVTMECAGNGRARLDPRPVSQPWLVEAVGTAEWTGVPLREVLGAAGLGAGAAEVVFTGADHGVERGVEQDYQRSLPVAEAMREEVLLAYEMNGAPLAPQHGYPLRLVVPGWYGMTNVKWLRDITVTDEPFTGFQQAVAYRLRQEAGEEGEPVTRIRPRALLVPPGFPDFMSRTRIVRPGPVRLEGRAWSGEAPVERVEVSVDGGLSWAPAELDGDGGTHPWAWRRFRFDWTAGPGRHELSARAVTADGTVQPEEEPWNRGGFANNAVQRVPVVCVPAGTPVEAPLGSEDL